ncbi:MAG: divergent polysaccharide deacetylase family protein [Campylobacter sp.]
MAAKISKATKATKRRPPKKDGWRSKNQILTGIVILAALIIITLIAALNGIGNSGAQSEISQTRKVAPQENPQSPKISQVKPAKEANKSSEKKREKWYKEPSKFDDDENLSRLFGDISVKDEFSGPKEKSAKSRSDANEKPTFSPPLPSAPREKSESERNLAPQRPLVAENLSKAPEILKAKNLEQNLSLDAQISQRPQTAQMPQSTQALRSAEPQEPQVLEKNASAAPKTEQNLTSGQVKAQDTPETKEPKKGLKQEKDLSQKGRPSKDKPQNFTSEAPKKTLTGKPKLVLIIDDIAVKEHADMVRSIGLRVTPSIFPATRTHPDTPQIARGFEFFMIHLPMQAQHFGRPEIGTLNIGDSFESILARVQKIRADFPRAKFINNHTGSKFTSDAESMIKAYEAFERTGFTFVDSRTIASSVVAKIAKKYGKPYIARDVFLDDDTAKSSVKKRLKEAVELAKRRGFAIAIGHPKKNTIDAIKESKSGLLSEVEVVYLNELF